MPYFLEMCPQRSHFGNCLAHPGRRSHMCLIVWLAWNEEHVINPRLQEKSTAKASACSKLLNLWRISDFQSTMVLIYPCFIIYYIYTCWPWNSTSYRYLCSAHSQEFTKPSTSSCGATGWIACWCGWSGASGVIKCGNCSIKSASMETMILPQKKFWLWVWS